MPFDYLHPNRNEAFELSRRARAREVHLQSLRERATMLMRLDYTEADIVRRLEQNVEWDFAKWSDKLPDFYAEIPDLVKELFRRHRRR